MRYRDILLAALVAIPGAAAYRSGIAPLDMPVEMISTLFNIPSLRSELVQIGFLRFGIWLLVFTLGFYSLNKVFKNDRKTAGILSATIAFIGAIFMPRQWVITQGGLITSIVTAALVLGLVIGGIYGISYLANNKEHWLLRLLAVALAFMLLFILEVIEVQTGSYLPLILLLPMPRGET